MKTYLMAAVLLLPIVMAGCKDDPVDPAPIDTTPVTLPVLGLGAVPDRYTSELWIHGSYAYTGTWGKRGTVAGNAVKIWNIEGSVPALVDSVIVANAATIGDVQVSDDGRLLVVATEFRPGSIVMYDLANPARPQFIARFNSPNTDPGVHTATLARVNGRLYAFLAIDPSASPARLVIVDIADPSRPTEVLARTMGRPYIHDVFVENGFLYTALWDDGISIFDIGGGNRGGSPNDPIEVGNIETQGYRPGSGSSVHNAVVYQEARSGSPRYLLIGEEVPVAFGTTSAGDIHVVDITNPADLREVAFYTVDGAGTHNFSVDKTNGILYAAYYNAGVRALDVTGNLSACAPEHKDATGRCDLGKAGREVARGLDGRSEPVYVWGVFFDAGTLFASDMLNGLWKLDAGAVTR